MKVTDNKRKKILGKAEKARALYERENLSAEEIARVIGRTRQWVWMSLKGGNQSHNKTIQKTGWPDLIKGPGDNQ